MTDDPKSSPRPWFAAVESPFAVGTLVCRADGIAVADVYVPADADLIVTAVNERELLLVLVEAARAVLAYMPDPRPSDLFKLRHALAAWDASRREGGGDDR
jgi:hypothetical protein